MCHHRHYRYHHLKREFYFHFKVTHLFQRTKITAATIPIIDRQNGNTIDTASTVLRFSTLFARGLALPATDPLDTGAVVAVCNRLEVFSVGVTVVKLFGLFVF